MNGEGLTPSEAEELTEAFHLFDKDGNGKICTTELSKVLRVLGLNPTEKSIQEMMEKFDSNESGYIEYEEYIKCIQGFMLSADEIEVQLKQAFLVFDKNKDSRLDIEELRRVLMSMGEPLGYKETCEILKLADVDKDGKLNVDEFTKFLCKKI
ncbi:hypothetical protein LOTGIDRAFT_203644 [Lottia gigantea]|uniref:EF-hand domain-containing protein n=1 Tax=Lottia gigantea TaxID=225164 RepID=V4AYG0_LOTGI|nr:hypothetical protein LOTGIDRAFT_203644 [Lottia gigantea]ESP00111.1 hypothetical protein LOTGIDRAFT_203644 [Lottia gigantea]